MILQLRLTIACRRLEIASAHSSLRLFPAPDAWRSAIRVFVARHCTSPSRLLNTLNYVEPYVPDPSSGVIA
jgi:hypothetical protein